jgi:maleate isomerase
VVHWRALEIPDNLEVGRHDPSAKLPGIVAGMDTPASTRSCSPPACRCLRCLAWRKVEAATGKPVLTAAIATTYAMLKALKLEPIVPGAGALLSGAY